ncbi:MAG: right-handed parallel beta-helix repeat-containing protein [Clostridia bacterium]|nr:right-handed parallel beta-helix repeat-containing protein [Clostridia bacterium]
MKKVYVTDFGAKSDSGLQTDKIQAAIDDVFMSGGGVVVVPEGDFEVGSIRIRSGIRLHLEKNAHLIGSKNPEDYTDILNDKTEPLSDEDKTDALWTPPDARKNFHYMNKAGSRWNNAIIKAVDAENIEITGETGAYIDGRDCFDEKGEERYRGPHAVNFYRCKNIFFEGYLIKNSANWAHALFDCSNITMENVCVEAGHDGIHVTSCSNVTINNCRFYTGDDCVAGIDNHNVTVTSCIMNTACSAFRFGGTNVLIDDCNIFGPAKYLFRGSLSDEEKRTGAMPNASHRYNMLSAFTYYSDFSREIKSTVTNIIMQNCTVENADRFLHYNFSGNETWQINKPLEQITFENIKASGIRNPVTAYGDAEKKISLTLKNCILEFAEDREEAPFMHLCNFKEVLLQNTTVKNIKGDILIKSWSGDKNLICSGFSAENFDKTDIFYTDEQFVCKPI